MTRNSTVKLSTRVQIVRTLPRRGGEQLLQVLLAMLQIPLLRRRQHQRVRRCGRPQRRGETADSLVVLLFVGGVALLTNALELAQEPPTIRDRVARDARQRVRSEVALASLFGRKRQQELAASSGMPLFDGADRAGRDGHLVMAG